MDINHFKTYNDTRGHLQGDQLLRDFAQHVQAQLRRSDQVARYGGDEFVVILPETDVEMTRTVVETLRGVSQAVLPAAEGVGLSLGCAALQPEMSAAALLELADQDMYRQKARHARR
jgi:diguanylate cyclase (GGDEF)-like protein